MSFCLLKHFNKNYNFEDLPFLFQEAVSLCLLSHFSKENSSIHYDKLQCMLEISPEPMTPQDTFFFWVVVVVVAKALISNSVDKTFKEEFSKILCKMRVQSSP